MNIKQTTISTECTKSTRLISTECTKSTSLRSGTTSFPLQLAALVLEAGYWGGDEDHEDGASEDDTLSDHL